MVIFLARKESAHEDASPTYDTPTPTHVGRHAAPQLLAPHYALLPPLCRRLRTAFWGFPRAPGSRAGPHLSTLSPPGQTGVLDFRGPDRLRAALLLPHDPRAPRDTG